MTSEARSCLAAASFALKAAGWSDETLNIGIVGAGYDGCVNADLEYFRDYIAQGQSLGRANLFIYTLPTSAMSEVAIALTLTGPTLHVVNPDQLLGTLVRQAKTIVERREADGMLCVLSDGPSAICFALGPGDPIKEISALFWNQPLPEVCRRLAALVPSP
jgi:hypothetical protein